MPDGRGVRKDRQGGGWGRAGEGGVKVGVGSVIVRQMGMRDTAEYTPPAYLLLCCRQCLMTCAARRRGGGACREAM